MSCVWHRLDVAASEGDLAYNLTTSDGVYTLLVTDGLSLYEETLGETEICQRCADLNPTLEANEAPAIIDEIVHLLHAKSTHVGVETSRVEEDQVIAEVQLNGKLMGHDINFRWIFEMAKASPKRFNECIAADLVAALHVLMSEKEVMLDIIRQKDAERMDYEESGAVLSRKSLKTDTFKVEHLNDKIGNEGNPSLATVITSERYNSVLESLRRIRRDRREPVTETSKPSPGRSRLKVKDTRKGRRPAYVPDEEADANGHVQEAATEKVRSSHKVSKHRDITAKKLRRL